MYLIIFGHPQKSPKNNLDVFTLLLDTECFNSSIKNNTPATGTEGARTKRSAIISLKF